jgi:pyrroline-5-carboxylate reductase
MIVYTPTWTRPRLPDRHSMECCYHCSLSKSDTVPGLSECQDIVNMRKTINTITTRVQPLRTVCPRNHRRNSFLNHQVFDPTGQLNRYEDLIDPQSIPSVAFIGGGRMGGAMLRSYVARYPNDGVHIIDPDPDCLHRFVGLRNVVRSQNPCPGLHKADIIVLATKPQVSSMAIKQIAPLLHPNQVVVSIMAGVTIDSLAESLDHAKVVRAMPNIPAQIGKGVSVCHPSLAVTEKDWRAAGRVLGACGSYMRVRSERSVDIATAISGSGPAYGFYLAEHMCSAAKEMGFDDEEAKFLVQLTLAGSLQLWESSPLPVEHLRRQVTSPGGTTEAAITYFDKQDLGFHIREGIRKSFERALELSKK